MGPQPVLDVRGLKTVFRTRGGEIHAVNDGQLHLRPRRTSGRGGRKRLGQVGDDDVADRASAVAAGRNPGGRGAAGRARPPEDEPTRSCARCAARKIGFVFQDPMTSLNPVFTVGNQIMEPLREHHGHDQGRRPRRGRWNCWNWSAFPMRASG